MIKIDAEVTRPCLTKAQESTPCESIRPLSGEYVSFEVEVVLPPPQYTQEEYRGPQQILQRAVNTNSGCLQMNGGGGPTAARAGADPPTDSMVRAPREM